MNTRAARTEFLRKGGYGFFYHFHYREQWLNPEEERLADDYTGSAGTGTRSSRTSMWRRPPVFSTAGTPDFSI